MTDNPQSAFIELVPEAQVAAELGVSTMSLWRWDREERKIAIGWPPVIKNGNRRFRERQSVEAFKAALIRTALEERESARALPSRRGRALPNVQASNERKRAAAGAAAVISNPEAS